MEFVNLTPHPIVVRPENGEDYVFPPSGTIARVSVTRAQDGDIAGIPVTRESAGDVTGVPAPRDGTVYIISRAVLGALGDRQDVVCPDTGAGAVRNEKGHIVAVRGFIR